MAAKYIFDQAQATTNTLLKGQLRMKVNISLVFLGAVAASTIALPAQAATVKTTEFTLGNTPMSAAAYAIDGVDVPGIGTYNVTFEYGTRASVYGLPTPEYPNADAIGNAIVKALKDNVGGAISLLTDRTLPNLADNILTDFYIPKSNTLPTSLGLPLDQQNSNRFVANCYAGTLNSCIDLQRSATQDDKLMYAKFSPIAGNVPQAPTPALIPGLLGMGLAAMRKKKQAAVVVQEA
jgi:hypothetical protein